MGTTRVLVVSDDLALRQELGVLLARQGYELIGGGSSMGAAQEHTRRAAPDIILVDGEGEQSPEGIGVAGALARMRLAPVLLLAAQGDGGPARHDAEAGVIGVLLKPVGEANLRPAIEVALSRFQEFAALLQETNDLREQLEALQLLESAKAVLMTRYNLSNAEAYRRIRKASVDIHMPMGAVAQAILQGPLISMAV